jgi:hypothetical protein
VVLQIAAGLKRELIVEIYAIAAGVEGNEGIGSISHSLEITTETHHMFLPISANILLRLHYISFDEIFLTFSLTCIHLF